MGKRAVLLWGIFAIACVESADRARRRIDEAGAGGPDAARPDGAGGAPGFDLGGAYGDARSGDGPIADAGADVAIEAGAHPDAAPDATLDALEAPDALEVPDASWALDASQPDVLPPDALPPDAALPDAALPDVSPDGPPPDAAPPEPDGAPPPDAAPPLPCGDGLLDPLEGCDDGNRRDGDGCSSGCDLEGAPLTFAGPRVGLEPLEASGGGFRRCYSSLYSAPLDVEALQRACQAPVLMLACRPAAEERFRVAAMGLRDQVLQPLPDGPQSAHPHNGAQWYFGPALSLGFAPLGAPLNRDPCDRVLNSRPTERLCWKTAAGSTGFRCGPITGLDGNARWERVVLERAGDLGPGAQICGDGRVQPPETCDDGNRIDGDGCSIACAVEPVPPPVCGDGQLEPPEACDDGNQINGDGCSSACQVELDDCGNGRVEFGEDCDDGNRVAGDGCDPLCTLEGPVQLRRGVEILRGSFDAGGADTYRFTADDQARLTAATSDGAAGCPGDTTLSLYPIDARGRRGARLAFDDDGAAGPCARLDRVPVGAGEYELAVAGPQRVEGYRLAFRLEVEVSGAGVFAGALAPRGDDLFSFSLPRRQTIILETGDGAAGCPGDTVITVFPMVAGRRGAQAAFDDDSGVRLCSRVEATLDPGDYDVVVQGFGGVALASYELSVTRPLSFPGVRTDLTLAEATAGAFEICLTERYRDPLDTLALQRQCNQRVLLLGCRRAGSADLTVAAMGLRGEVLRLVPNEADAAHDHNGARWYYNEGFSLGFGPLGQPLRRQPCDLTPGGDRLCWHTAPDQGGYRCGDALNLNQSNRWERVVLQRTGAL